MTEEKVYATDLEWLEWFYCFSDFGPADEDVRDLLRSEFEHATKKLVPIGYRGDC